MTTTVSADSAKQALLANLIDDASVFPPSELPVGAAVRAHLRHRESAYAWIGGNFVVPASRLDAFVAAVQPGEAVHLSVILDAAQRAKGDTVRADLDRIARSGVDVGSVAALEIRFRGALEAEALSGAAAAVAAAFPAQPATLYVELPYAGGWATSPDAALAVVAGVRSNLSGSLTIAAKVRCGGSTETTPSVADLAAFVVAAQAHGVPWKATAGLHHPVRGAHGEATMHGFLNLFIAGVAHHAGVLDAARVVDAIGEENPRAFLVDPMHVGWRDVKVEAEAVAAARGHCRAFGSCSFDEPVNGLRELGLLL